MVCVAFRRQLTINEGACRSPLAQGIMRLVHKEGLWLASPSMQTAVSVSRCGLMMISGK